jgi:predicted TPR repeat methyltransferase
VANESSILIQQALSLLRAGHIAQAKTFLEHEYLRNQSDPEIVWWLNGIASMENDSIAAERYAREMIVLKPEFGRAHSNLGMALLGQGRLLEAAEAFRQALRRDPDSATDKYMLATVSGGAPPTRAEAAPYVMKLFDNYAERFDEDLVGRLGYRVPEKLFDLIARTLRPEPGTLQILDMGCGTGLCGPHFRPLAHRLVGVDLSPRMIEKARERHIYDELVTGDFMSALAGRVAAFDLIIAADVFNYVGDLDDVFSGCRQALASGGALAFSVEELDGDGFGLQTTARFAHSTEYVEGLASVHGFVVRTAEATPLRIHRGEPALGRIFILCARKGVSA